MRSVDEMKQAVGRHAADTHVRSGMKIGMGTGSTAVWAIRRIGEQLAKGELTDIIGVATSFQSQLECERLAIPLRGMNDPAVDGHLDLVIDGADEIDPAGCVTKGGGGALLIEKVIAYASDVVVLVGDEKKLVSRLGLTFPIPVEIVSEARKSVLRGVRDLGGDGDLRPATGKMGPVITENGHPLLDLRFAEEFDPREMERELDSIPGVLGNGIFASMHPYIYIGAADGTVSAFIEPPA